jgi:hypothetical protein
MLAADVAENRQRTFAELLIDRSERPVLLAVAFSQHPDQHRRHNEQVDAPDSPGVRDLARRVGANRRVRAGSEQSQGWDADRRAVSSVSGEPQNSPIRSARSKSGRRRTWSSSTRGAGPRGLRRCRSLRSRVDTHRRSPSNRPPQRDEQKQGEPDADGIGGPVGKLGVSVDQAALGYLDQSTGSQYAQGNWDR